MRAKRIAARKALDLVHPGTVVGLGTGSTARYFVEALGERVAAGLDIRAVPSSAGTEQLARAAGIPIVGLDEVEGVALTVDGADEVDPDLRLIKGRGGAFVREKILAAASRQVVIIVDRSKVVDRLGGAHPVPVEVVRFGLHPCRRAIEAMGAEVSLRRAGEEPYISDNGNPVLDARFPGIPDPAALEREINTLPGVVDNGLFVDLATTIIVGSDEGVEVRRKPAAVDG